jgi:hypothetical protein
MVPDAEHGVCWLRLFKHTQQHRQCGSSQGQYLLMHCNTRADVAKLITREFNRVKLYTL